MYFYLLNLLKKKKKTNSKNSCWCQTLFSIKGEAPYSISSFTTAWYPAPAAMWRAVLPSWEERNIYNNITKESNQKASVSMFTKTQINGVAVMTKVPKRHMSALHAMKNFGLNFQKFPEANETAISGIQGEINLLRHTEILGNYRSMTCLTEFPELSVQWLALLKFNNIRSFWKRSQEITILFVPVSKVSKFLVDWKAPMFSLMKN